MNWLLIALMSLFLIGCGCQKEEETAREQKERHDQRYKTPPPSDRSKDKGF